MKDIEFFKKAEDVHSELCNRFRKEFHKLVENDFAEIASILHDLSPDGKKVAENLLGESLVSLGELTWEAGVVMANVDKLTSTSTAKKVD